MVPAIHNAKAPSSLLTRKHTTQPIAPVDGARASPAAPGLDPAARAFVSSAHILSDFREGQTIIDAMLKQRRAAPAYSAVVLFHGGLLCSLGLLRAGFKLIWGSDSDPNLQRMWEEVTGTPSFPDAFNLPETVRNHRPMVLHSTPRCIDYSTGGRAADGSHGDNDGWQFVKQIEVIVKIKPLVVVLEMVGNCLWVNEGTEVKTVLQQLQDNGYINHSALVTMQQYGDIINKRRFVNVAISSELGEYAKAYRIPLGCYSDAVSFTARDIVAPDTEINESSWRELNDKLVTAFSQSPGKLQMASRVAPGQGFSANPHACYKLDGIAPCTTQYGGGRRVREGWKEGDPIGSSIMFTPQECANAYNLTQQYLELTQLIDDSEAFKWQCLGNGFTQRFGYELDKSIDSMLSMAGVPWDITHTTVIPGDTAGWGVSAERRPGSIVESFPHGNRTCHEMNNNKLSLPREININATALAARFERACTMKTADCRNKLYKLLSTCDNTSAKVISLMFDTGASHLFLYDIWDSYLRQRLPATNVGINTATEGGDVYATSRGLFPMATINSDFTHLSTKAKPKGALVKLEMPAITAPRQSLARELFGFRHLYQVEKWNLDIRQAELGMSCI